MEVKRKAPKKKREESKGKEETRKRRSEESEKRSYPRLIFIGRTERNGAKRERGVS